MVKKIKKYLKFVVCCVLILSLIAPSYAALSASDGSAFVTKAEFDSALADFNARLTSFEAGINSKIDSQVTSYLDRNGIWNGAEQRRFFGAKTSIIMRFGTNGVVPLLYDINKSGLLHLQIKLKLYFTGMVTDFQRSYSFYCLKDTQSFLSKVYMCPTTSAENWNARWWNPKTKAEEGLIETQLVANAGGYSVTYPAFGTVSGNIEDDVRATSFDGPTIEESIDISQPRYVAVLKNANVVNKSQGYVYTSYMTTGKDGSTYDPTDNGTMLQLDFFQFVCRGGVLVAQFGNYTGVQVMADSEVGANVRQAGFVNSADVY